jgi:hypothetical protein
MTKKIIPFGELTLMPSQVNKMGKALWEHKTCVLWNELTDREKEKFIGDYIVTIPKVLGVIGLKVISK